MQFIQGIASALFGSHLDGVLDVVRTHTAAAYVVGDQLIRQHPWACVGGAALGGLMFGLLVSGRRRQLGIG